ncbi:hypothetical protein QE152_g7380 [Popillia japonica]|uniref:Uncharacterized protein n=1 Tax=Popillia japonica TaxID=7064 RepID=A0AAW1ME36_POPJA
MADFLTSNLVMATSEQKHTATRFSKRLYRNSGFELGSHLCYNLGDGDVEPRNCDRSIRKYAILSHSHTRDKTISNTKKKQMFGERKCYNQILSPVIIYPLLSNENSKASRKPISCMMLVYDADNNKRDTVVKQNPLSERPSSTQPHISQLHVLPDIKEEGDSIEGDKMSIAEGLDSDIYRFKPTDTAIDDIYLERIRHIWLKSGLRKHLSQLSNLKLKPVLEWRKLRWPETHEPEPVLEKLEVEPDARETEIIEISHVDPKTSSKLYLKLPLEDDILDRNIIPILFNKLKGLDRNQKYQIQLSSSESDQDTIEPCLANVGPSLEHLDDAFIDWVLGLGIPLAKISQQEVQTSHENLRKLKLFKSAPKAPIEQNCSCDLPINLSDILPAPQTNINVNQKRTVPPNIGYSTFQKKRYSQPPQLVTNKESIQKEILDILNSIINKLDHEVQKQLLTSPASRKPKRKKQKILLPSSNVHNDYCGLKDYPDDNHVCRVKIDKKPISKFNPKFEDGIKEEFGKPKIETNETSFKKKSFLKHLKKQIISSRSKPIKTDVSCNTEIYSYDEQMAQQEDKFDNQKLSQKYNFDKNLKYVDNKVVDSKLKPPGSAKTLGKNKLYSSSPETATQLNEKLSEVTLNNQSAFTMVDNADRNNYCSANSVRAQQNESRIKELLQQRQCSRISEAYRLCLYNFEKNAERSNKLYISVKNRQQQKPQTTNSSLKTQLENSDFLDNLPEFSANTENSAYPISKMFAIKSLEKLVTKYYGKSDYSNLIDMQKYQYALLRKTFESERHSWNRPAAALQNTSPHESDSSSSDGYFSNTSSLEDTVGLKSANLNDFNVLSEKVYSYTNVEKSVSNSDYKNSEEIESNQSSKNLSNTKSKTIIKEV